MHSVSTFVRGSLKLVPRLIAFLGPDGAGKSTHVELLINFFKSHRSRVRKVWIRSPHTLAYLLSCFLVRIGFYRVVSKPFGRQWKIPAVNTSQSFKILWSVIELVSVLPLILFRVYIPLYLGYTLVAERYVVDTIVNIAYFTNDLNFLQSRLAKFLLYFVPKNTIFIHLDSEYSVIMKRRHRMVESYDFIEFQRVGYKIIGDSVSAKYIDTSNISVKQTSMLILHWLRINQVFETNN